MRTAQGSATSTAKVGRRPVVALLIETSNAYTRGLLRGIRDWMRKHGDWAIHLTEQARGSEPPPWLDRWHGDGIIARIENPATEKAVRAAHVPVVNVSAAGLAPEFPTVITDSNGAAQAAFEHLRERGLKHFGFCGDGRFFWSANHQRHFQTHVANAGFECDVFDSQPEDALDWEREVTKLRDWLQSLPKPVGVMACYDIRGQQVLGVCRHNGIKVPDEVSVIGLHNDELLCDLCDPPLSSVIPNPARAGYEAADILHEMMRGHPHPAALRLVPPLGVAVRGSTDIVAIEDARIASAVRFIRANACKGIGVGDVLRIAPMSRTLLERKFKRYLGRTPYEEILLMKLRRVKELLTETDLSIAEIAERTGFSGPEYLSAAFKKHTGTSPGRYRSER